MANYEVTLAYSITADPAPNEDCPHVAYWSVDNVPDELVGEARLEYIKIELLRRGQGVVVRVKDLRIMRHG